MRTLITGMLCLAISISLTAQDQVNERSPEVTTTNVVFDSGNTIYLNNVKAYQSATIIKKLQNLVANYKIKDSKVYKANDKSMTYDVDFEELNCKITATYNHEGVILKTIEEYKNMKLPYKLASDIAKKNPDWFFNDNTQVVSYNKEKGAEKIFMVKIKNKEAQKLLKFKLTNSADPTDYVVMN